VIQYFSQSGDTLPALSRRFQVDQALILSSQILPANSLLAPGTELWIPNRLDQGLYGEAVLPDSEVIHSIGGLDFDVAAYIDQNHGYLSTYQERVQGEQLSGAQIIQRVAIESSVSPRVLLTLLELRSGWLRGLPEARIGETYPIGFRISGSEGLYKELVMASTHLNSGYYGWREGTLSELQFPDGTTAQLDPRLNAGSVGVQNLLAKLYRAGSWQTVLYGPAGFIKLHRDLFGDPWARAASAGSIFPAGVGQPLLELPFLPGERWSLTGGPHPAWKTGSPRGAIDLAPVTGEAACAVSGAWVTAPAAGIVARSARNVVALDLDGDGREQTGWVLIFLHIADHERVAEGVRLNVDERIGHPSCEGGTSTGTHVHFARKLNGEWLPADWPLPTVLGGWQVYAGQKNYSGGMKKDGQEVQASPVGPRTSIIVRQEGQ
jgi:murein DD-endopeptidase MepM/ murein hydrolase activator NlpD